MCLLVVGVWCLFSEDFPVDEEVADIFSPKGSWNKRFLCGPNSCSCCGKPVADSHKVLLKDFLASSTEHKFFRLKTVQEDLAKNVFKDTSHSLSFLFQRFLRMSLDERCCTTCSSVFQLVYGVFKDKDSLLNFDCLKEQSARDTVFNESDSESSSDDGSDIEESESEEEPDAPPIVEYENPFMD